MTIQRVIAVLPLQVVCSVATVESVVLCAATDKVVTVFAVELVFTGSTVQGVVARAGVHGVVPGQTQEGVGAGVAVQGVVLAGGREHLGLDGVDVPDGAVGKLDLLDLVAVGGVVGEVVVDPQGVGAAVDGQHQGVALALEHHVGSEHSSAQLDQIELANRSVVGADGVFARTLAEQVGVVARSAVQAVVACTTVEGVVTCIAIDSVVAQTTRQSLVGRSTVDRDAGRWGCG